VKSQGGGLAERVSRFLERVEYRRADSEEEKHAIYRLRHVAYTRAGTVEPRASGLFTDALDSADNAWLIALYIDGDLAGAIRLHVAAGPAAGLPASLTFPDAIEPLLAARRVLIDPSRFVSNLEYSRLYPEMPYITLRPAFLAEQHFGADFITAACLVEHQAFYRRSGSPWRDPRPYPNFKRPISFIEHDCNALRENRLRTLSFLSLAR
jgi:hypothetical protein